MTLETLCKKLDLTLLTAPEGGLETPVSGCYIGDLLSWVMGRAQKGEVWVTIMTNMNVAAVASLSELAGVIIAEGCAPDEGLVQKAGQNGVCLLSSKDSAYVTACKIYEAFKEETI